MTFAEAGHSYEAGDDEHDTPMEFFHPIARAVDGFDLDPCASDSSDLADRNVAEDEDGLSVEWCGRVWMNPPYSEVEAWMQRAREQYIVGNMDLTVCLVYARTGTQWYHEYARDADVLCFVEGRLTFGGGEYSAPAPSLVAVYGDAGEGLVGVLGERGHVVRGGGVGVRGATVNDF